MDNAAGVGPKGGGQEARLTYRDVHERRNHMDVFLPAREQVCGIGTIELIQ